MHTAPDNVGVRPALPLLCALPGATRTIAPTRPSTAPSRVRASARSPSAPPATPAPRTAVTRAGPAWWRLLTWHCHAGTQWPGCDVTRHRTWRPTSAGELCHSAVAGCVAGSRCRGVLHSLSGWRYPVVFSMLALPGCTLCAVRCSNLPTASISSLPVCSALQFIGPRS